MLAGLSVYFFICVFIFCVGFAGILLNRKNLILMLMSVELMVLAVNVMAITVSISMSDSYGILFSLLFLPVVAAETAIGMAILIRYYGIIGSILFKEIN